jgi:hypothetical protein
MNLKTSLSAGTGSMFIPFRRALKTEAIYWNLLSQVTTGWKKES